MTSPSVPLEGGIRAVPPRRGPIPRWVWAVSISLALLEPVAYFWFAYGLPEACAPTGMRIQDDALFRVSMRMAESRFCSPYAPPDAPLGAHSIQYFRTPYYWLYGAVGLVRWALGLDEFLFLGIANGLGALLYLLAVFWFLREAAPKLAQPAFLLHTLSGGCGGVLYWVSLALGWTHAPGFEDAFRRFAVYQLIEGAYIYPYLQISRLYYTVPMALGFMGLALCWRWLGGHGPRRDLWISAGLFFVACWINQRLGPLFWAAALCYTFSGGGRPWRAAWTGHAAWGLSVAAASLASWAMMTPQFKASTESSNAAVIWLTPFLCATYLHLPLVPRAIRRGLHAMPFPAQLATGAALGYIAAYAGLFALYQTYYGNLLVLRDAPAAVAVSDWALFGALAGCTLLFALRRSPVSLSAAPGCEGWAGLWFLLLLAGGLGAFFGGWTLRFSPFKLLVLMGVPLCLLAASTLAELRGGHPRWAAAWWTALLASGVLSILAAWLFFQGPLGWRPGEGAFAPLHVGAMSAADARVLEQAPRGRLLAPATMPLFGDIAVVQYRRQAVFGEGMLGGPGPALDEIRRDVERFFAPDTPDAERQALALKWRVDSVFCPDSKPIDLRAMAALRAAPWLSETACAGRAALFAVRTPAQKGE